MLMCIYFRYYAIAVHRPRRLCAAIQICRCRGACCLDIGFRHMFSALDGVILSWHISRAVRFPSCAFTDASPGVGSLVGREFSQSLEAWLLVSVLRWVGATGVLYCILFYS